MGTQHAGEATGAQFRKDLGQSAGVLVGDPLLPALTAFVVGAGVALGRLGPGWNLLGLPVDLFLVGFAGTERVWFLRRYRFRTLDHDEITTLTSAFLPRYLLLVLITGVPFVAAAVVLRRVGLPLAVLGAAMAADVALTFVTPALALSTRSCREGLRLGFRMLRATWPASVPYVLAPGLALAAAAASMPKTIPGLGIGLAAAGGGVLSLWFKGAVVAFYLRLRPQVADNGAAFGELCIKTGKPDRF